MSFRVPNSSISTKDTKHRGQGHWPLSLMLDMITLCLRLEAVEEREDVTELTFLGSPLNM